MTDVDNEPREKPSSPITEPVTQIIRDPYRVIAAPIKMPAHISSRNNNLQSFDHIKNLQIYSNLVYLNIP